MQPVKVLSFTIFAVLVFDGWNAQARVGPSYNCDAPVIANQPLAQMICKSDELSAAELGYVIAFQARRQVLGEQQLQALLRDANAFVQNVAEVCRLPVSGKFEREPSDSEVSCIKSQYEQQRSKLMDQLNGDALGEAQLSPREAIDIQKLLMGKRILATDAMIDGIFGPASRDAIMKWQRTSGWRVTGFASRAMLDAMARSDGIIQSTTQAPPSLPRQDPLSQRINDAIALTREQWQGFHPLIRNIEIGFRCGVIDQFSTDFAFQYIINQMVHQKWNNGLINDTTLDVTKDVQAVVDEAKLIADEKVDPGFSSRVFTPADRERLRQTVNRMMQ